MSRDVINGQYDIKYLPTQLKVLKCAAEGKTPNICLCEGFGGGKTRLIGEIILEFMIACPGIEIGVFRKTRVSIRDTTYRTFIRKVCPPEYMDLQKTRVSMLYVQLLNGSSCQFFGIDNYLRKGSLEFDMILTDESIELEEEDHRMLEGRLRGGALKTPIKIDCTNAGAPGTYLHKTYVQNSEKKNPDPDFKYFESTSFENIYNPPAFHKRLAKWKGTIYYPRFVLSKWTAFEGLVYGMVWEPDEHVIKPFEIPITWKKRVIVDFGYTIQHPLVFLWIAQNPGTGVRYVYRQYYMTGVLQRHADDECKRITAEAGEVIDTIIGDHDAEGRAQVEHDWMAVTPAVKDIKAGIQAVMETLLPQQNKMRGLYVFNNDWSEIPGLRYGLFKEDVLLKEHNLPTCVQEEFPKYAWGNNDKPKATFDHGLDGIRYDIMTERRKQDEQEWGEIVGESARAVGKR